MSAASVLGVIAGYIPLVEIEAILRDITGSGVVRTEDDRRASFEFTTETRLIKGFYERADIADGEGPIVEEHTSLSMGSDTEGIAVVRGIVGYYGGFVLEDANLDTDWIAVPATGKALPLTQLDRYEQALIGTLSPPSAKILREIAESEHVLESFQHIFNEYFPPGNSPKPR